MTGYGQQPSPTSRVIRGLRELLFAPGALSDQRAGVNLVEALVLLAEAIDRNTVQLQRFNDFNDRGT